MSQLVVACMVEHKMSHTYATCTTDCAHTVAVLPLISSINLSDAAELFLFIYLLQPHTQDEWEPLVLGEGCRSLADSRSLRLNPVAEFGSACELGNPQRSQRLMNRD